MALGGGTFVVQNKKLPGTYINFVSAVSATATLGERGVAAMPLELDWGSNEIIDVTSEDFQKNSMKIFGYAYTDDKLKGIREVFLNASELYVYNLASDGKKAENTLATALYTGVRGNDIKISIQKNIDDTSKFDVVTYVDTTVVDTQTVSAVTELVSNDYVTFKTDVELNVTAATPLTGGANGTVNTAAHQSFIDKIEAYPSVNAIGVVTTDDTLKSLYTAFTKRMRDEVGVKFQTVLYNKSADYEGVVNVKNACLNADNEANIVYWVTGVIAGCAVNASNSNKIYNGEYEVDTNYTQAQLGTSIDSGEFVLHKVGSEIRVLEDINSLVTVTEDKGEVFKDNQTVRVCDRIATDIASVFATKYLGTVPNDSAGRVSLWADIVKHHGELQKIRAIENFSSDDVVVSQGDTKKSVVVQDTITVVNAMNKLYMTVTVE